MLANIKIAAEKNQVPYRLLYAICKVESNFKPTALNEDDGTIGEHSYGLCQVKLKTAQRFDKKATPEKLMKSQYNLNIAAKYLRYQLNRYDFNHRKATLAYNAGSYILNKRGQPINQKYSDKVFKIVFTDEVLNDNIPR